jgi:hypothetical protein
MYFCCYIYISICVQIEMMLKLKYMVVVPVGDTKNGADWVCVYI